MKIRVVSQKRCCAERQTRTNKSSLSMCYEEIACPKCSSLNVKKNDITAQRKQRYRCKGCKCKFIIDGLQSQCRERATPNTLSASSLSYGGSMPVAKIFKS